MPFPSEPSPAEASALVPRRRPALESWAGPGSAVYANPICAQLDQLLLRCGELEDVLALTVTHRGVFFVHNLVTAVQVLGAMAAEQNDPIAVNAMLRDPRYDLLIRDLLRFVPKLDFVAMTNVACSLRQLDHKQYFLLSRMLSTLLRQTAPDVATLLRCAQAYSWAGYHSHTEIYARFAAYIAERAPEMSSAELVEACGLFGRAEHYQAGLFNTVEQALVGQDLIERELSPQEVGVVAGAFSAHLRTSHDEVMGCVARYLEREAQLMEVPDIAKCLRAFRRMALHFEGAVLAGLGAAATPLRRAWLMRRRAEGVRSADVAALLDCAAFFGVRQEDLTRPALDYLSDHVDVVGEQAAIHTVYAMCLTGGIVTHQRMLLYLFRKIGAGTAWEAHKVRVFQLWISQLLQFPWLDARLRRRCVDSGFRAWSLHRRGYGCPFPDEARDVAAELEAMGVPHRTFVHVPDTPYEIDVAIGRRKDAFLVTSEVARNTLQPVGGTLLQMHHLKARGWRCVVVPRRLWQDLSGGPSGARRQYLQSLLTAFAD